MAKKKEKLTAKIKTSRYWTKTCSNPKCNFEYPNWFTSCPKCHTSWTQSTSAVFDKMDKIPSKKTIKIVVKITDESPENPIIDVRLRFTADGGNSWFQVPMEKHQDFYLSEIEEMPLGSKVIYYIEAEDASGEIYIENNDGKYFAYYVETQPTVKQSAIKAQKKTRQQQREGDVSDKPFLYESQNFKKTVNALEKKTQQIVSQIQTQSKPPQEEVIFQDKSQPQPVKKGSPLHPVKVPQKGSPIKKSQVQPVKIPQKSNSVLTPPRQKITKPKVQEPQQPKIQDNELTIFGKPQRKIDENLKVCPNCQSKIKSVWTSCPICGYRETS